MRLHTHFPPFEKGRASPGLILCLCGAFPAPSLLRSGPLSPLTPDGTSFNIQNPIPHPSQKEKVLLETRRPKECQRGTAGAEERAKEGGRVLAEGSDTRLGPRGRRFESCHLDHQAVPGRNSRTRRSFFFYPAARAFTLCEFCASETRPSKSNVSETWLVAIHPKLQNHLL